MLHFIFLKSEVVMGKLGHSDVKWAHVKTSNVDLYIFEKKTFCLSKFKISKVDTIRAGNLRIDRSTWISNLDTLNFLLNPLFFLSFYISRRDSDLKDFWASDWLFGILCTPHYWLDFIKVEHTV